MLSALLSGTTVTGFEIAAQWQCVLRFNKGLSLSFECLGRYIGKDGAFLTTTDDGQQFGLPKPFDAAAEIERRIKGRKVERAVVREDTNDLTLHFADGILEVICSSAGYEAYQLRGPNNLLVVARGGKEPNQAPEPTPGSVTPRADQSESK